VSSQSASSSFIAAAQPPPGPLPTSTAAVVGSVTQGQTFSGKVAIDGTGPASFSLAFGQGDLGLTLISAIGQSDYVVNARH